MKTNKQTLIFGLFFLFILLLSLNVNSVGVSSPYWNDYPLYAQPGTVKEIMFVLQNYVGSEDISMKAEIEGDSSIIQLLDTNSIYDVPLGSETPIKAKITIPSDAKEGDSWDVGVKFTVTSKSIDNQPLSIGTAYVKSFKVIVGQGTTQENTQASSQNAQQEETSQKNSSNLTWLIIAIILVIIILILMFLKMKKSSKIKGEAEKENLE